MRKIKWCYYFVLYNLNSVRIRWKITWRLCANRYSIVVLSLVQPTTRSAAEQRGKHIPAIFFLTEHTLFANWGQSFCTTLHMLFWLLDSCWESGCATTQSIADDVLSTFVRILECFDKKPLQKSRSKFTPNSLHMFFYFFGFAQSRPAWLLNL
jgi:hypothetical protein